MRKLLTFLKTLIAVLAVIVLFTACKQLLDDPEDFLSYWASETFVKNHSIDSAHRPDGAGVPCVGSLVSVDITLSVHNPKGFSFVMPTSSVSAGIVEFKELSSHPEAGTDYELQQTGSGTLKLKYNPSLLQKYEQGSGSLNPTITLKAKDGRVFKQTYTFGIKSNTPPPKPAVVLAKQTNASPEPSYYVLCIDTNDLGALSDFVSGKHIHDDIAYVTINGTPYNLKMNNTHSGFSEKPTTGPFLENGTGLTPAGIEQLPTASPWVLYYKTNIRIGAGNPQTSYTVTLRDKEGVTSDEAAATIAASDPTHTVTFSIAAGKGKLKGEYNDGSTPYSNITQNVGNEVKFENVPHGTQVIFTATPATSGSWEVAGWTKNDAAVNGTNNTYAISVTENTTVTVKFYQPEIDGTASMSWKALLSAVRNAPANATIKINGEINATPTSGNNGEILINKNLTIKGNTGANSDKLNAITLSRIFKVKTGNTLTLENITLKNGKAPDDPEAGDTKDGGGIYSEGTLTLKNTTIEGCQAANGGALYVHGATAKITNCTLMGNKADTDGGAVYAKKQAAAAHITIEGGAIKNNTAVAQWGSGGGIYINDGCTLTLNTYNNIGTEISGNKAGHGGGVQAINSTVTMTKCTITGNHATKNQGGQGGGVSTDRGKLTMTDCSITENTVPKVAQGGGMAIKDTVVKITNCTIENNEVDVSSSGGSGYGSGGGVCVTGGSFEMTGGTIKGNKAYNGSGVCVNDGSFEMSGVHIENNNTVPNDGRGSGGGVYVSGKDSSFKMTSGTINGNKAQNNSGGGVCVIDGSFEMTGGEINGNTAKEGGGVYVNEKAAFTMYGGTITDNKGGNKGKGVYVASSAYDSNIPGGEFIMGAEACVGKWKSNGTLQDENDVYLGKNLITDYLVKIKIDKDRPITKSKVAHIWPHDYDVGRLVLVMTDGSGVAKHHNKFTVQPTLSNWEVDSDGKLKVKQP